MAQTERLTAYHSTHWIDGFILYVECHSTLIVRAHLSTGFTELECGGYWTRKTRDDMNRASRQFGLGYTVSCKNFKWFVTDCVGERHSFSQHQITIPTNIIPRRKVRKLRADLKVAA